MNVVVYTHMNTDRRENFQCRAPALAQNINRYMRSLYIYIISLCVVYIWFFFLLHYFVLTGVDG